MCHWSNTPESNGRCSPSVLLSPSNGIIIWFRWVEAVAYLLDTGQWPSSVKWSVSISSTWILTQSFLSLILSLELLSFWNVSPHSTFKSFAASFLDFHSFSVPKEKGHPHSINLPHLSVGIMFTAWCKCVFFFFSHVTRIFFFKCSLHCFPLWRIRN